MRFTQPEKTVDVPKKRVFESSDSNVCNYATCDAADVRKITAKNISLSQKCHRLTTYRGDPL